MSNQEGHNFKVYVGRAIDEPELCEKYITGHRKVLTDYGIANITSNNNDWMHNQGVYVVFMENEKGKMVGGIRVQKANSDYALPVETAIGKIDPKIYKIVDKYREDGICELSALWNSKEVAGLGLSLLLVRAGISITNQINCKMMIGIRAEYTNELFRRVGFVVDESLGDNGKFIYPNENYIAKVVGILNAQDLYSADQVDRKSILGLREVPEQTRVEIGNNGVQIQAEYLLYLKQNKMHV